MRILVTGGAGFIGKHLVSRLQDLDHVVHVLDYRGVKGVIFGDVVRCTIIDKYDVVFHLAAMSRVGLDGQQTMITNIIGTHNVLKWGKKLIFASSCAALEPESSVYAMSKHVGEEIIRAFHNDAVILRLYNVYGPGDTASFIARCQEQDDIVIFGDGGQMRSFVHVDDVVDAMLSAMDAESGTYAVNGELYGINTVASWFNKRVTHIPARQEMRYIRVTDSRLPGWAPKRNLKEYLGL